jgi:hypothetical protein
MRRPDADLEEKREPRVTSAGAQKGDEVIRAGLTLAAIEKQTFAGTHVNGRDATLPAVRGTAIEPPVRSDRPFGEHWLPPAVD